jgi:hypothetical protein
MREQMISRRTELVDHGANAVALLDTLVRDAQDARRVSRRVRLDAFAASLATDGRERHGRQERVRHRLHVHQADRLELAHRRTGHGRLVFALLDLAPHAPQDVDREPGVALERRRANVLNRAGSPGDGRHRKWIRRAARVALDRILFGIGVLRTRNVVHIEQRAVLGLAAGNLDAKCTAG